MSCGNCETETQEVAKPKSKLVKFLQIWVSFIVFLGLVAAAICGLAAGLMYVGTFVSTFWFVVLAIVFVAFLAAILGME